MAQRVDGWTSCGSAFMRRSRDGGGGVSKEKHKLTTSNLASCQVSLKSVQRFQRRSQKCLSQSEARVAILFFSLRLWCTKTSKTAHFNERNSSKLGSKYLLSSTMLGVGGRYLLQIVLTCTLKCH